MKTYKEYLKEIEERDDKEVKKRYKEHKKECSICGNKVKPGESSFNSVICAYNMISPSRMSVDISIEILVMAMKDFLNELNDW